MMSKTDTDKLIQKMKNNSSQNLIIPAPSFTLMNCEMIDYDENEKSIRIRIPISETWLNPYGTMQGGLIEGAIDNAVGPLSLLIASTNMTRYIETKFIKAITPNMKYIYVKANLKEQKKKRLTFEASVEDELGKIYVESKVVNFIL